MKLRIVRGIVVSLLIALIFLSLVSDFQVAAQDVIRIGLPGQDVELMCDVIAIGSGSTAWRINGSLPAYSLSNLRDGAAPGHNVRGMNSIIIEDIMMNDVRNGSQYQCEINSDDIPNSVLGNLTILYVAGVPAMVPGVTVDDNTININGNNVTLTLRWGEPFNNLDPIVNYSVSCSSDVTCPPSFAVADNTTRSYTITNLTPMTNYTFSIVATNSIGSGEAGVVMITTLSAIGQVTQVTLTCEPVRLINQCTVTWKPVTQGDITGYQVYYNGTTRNVDSSTTALTFTAPLLPDGLFTGTVVVTVAAISRLGVGPTSNPLSALIFVASSVINATPMLVCTPAVSELYNITVTCAIHPESIADQCVVMAMTDGRVARIGIAPITEGMAIVTISDLKCGVTYNITAEGMLNETLVGPGSFHGNITSGPCPLPSTVVDDTDKQDDEFSIGAAIDDKSDDELSTGAAVAISIVITLIITLVITALITYIITSLYYKHLIKKLAINREGDSHALTEDIKKHDPTYATANGSITMDTNPAYGTTATIKMDTNPAYATASH